MTKKPSLEQLDAFTWRIPQTGTMRVPAVVYGARHMVENIEPLVFRQLANVASLPGVVREVDAMPDAHSGYGFPIGGVAAFDADRGGIVSAGGVGFDIACGVRAMVSGLHEQDILERATELADQLFRAVPTGTGGGSRIGLNEGELQRALAEGAGWAVDRGYGEEADLAAIEHRGAMPGADPEAVSAEARKRGADQMGTLGSGNHYLEVQAVDEIYEQPAADAFGLAEGRVIVSIHCGSRGLGHQVATDYQKAMNAQAKKHGLSLPDAQLAAAPLRSELGRRYLAAMAAAANFAMANRQSIAHFVRSVFRTLYRGEGGLRLLADVSHNTCTPEEHIVDGRSRRLHIHRKGATRALPPGHPGLDPRFKDHGQPVLVGGSMGTASYILAGAAGNSEKSFSSACHGAGRVLSRGAAKKRFKGEQVIAELKSRHIVVKAGSTKGAAEEAPGAYKDVSEVVDATATAGLARKIARVRPLISVKG